MTAIGAIRPCARGIFAGPAAEAVWGISDPKETFCLRTSLGVVPVGKFERYKSGE
jgi:hypothetical protein